MTNTLDGLGRTVLETIEERPRTVDVLKTEIDAPGDEVEDRLEQLVDNALVHQVDDEYELTDNGRRLLEATPTGILDDRIDTPDRVERAIEGFDCTPEERSAIRSAFSFLRYWGEATTAELVDAVYSEFPAGYDAPEEWWNRCIRGRLAALPDVDPPADESPGERWRYGGKTTGEPIDRDGRAVGTSERDRTTYGSVRHGIESEVATDAERAAARAAFAVLYDRGTATTDELAQALYQEFPAEHDTIDRWKDWLDRLFAALPDVDRREEDDGENAWAHEAGQ